MIRRAIEESVKEEETRLEKQKTIQSEEQAELKKAAEADFKAESQSADPSPQNLQEVSLSAEQIKQ